MVAEVKTFRHADGQVVETLEKLLEQAKKGQLRAIAFATVSPGHHTGNGWAIAEDVNIHVLNSSVSILHARFGMTFIELSQSQKEP